jgi:hypothetical protein
MNIEVDEIGLIHDKMAPALIANEDRRSMGLMISFSSLRRIKGLLCEDAHIVTTLKRME